MNKIKVFEVCQDIEDERFVLATCTDIKYAEKAIKRLVNENFEDEDCLYIEENEIILNAIYGWHDGDLTE